MQAHIDPAGLWLGSKWFWWIGIPVTGFRHLLTQEWYKDPFKVRDILLEQGWWPRVLRRKLANCRQSIYALGINRAADASVQRQSDDEKPHPFAARAASHAESLLTQKHPKIWFDSWYNDKRDNNPPKNKDVDGKTDDDDPVEKRTKGRDGIHYRGGKVWPSGARISLFGTTHIPPNSIMYKVCTDIARESYKKVGISLSRSVQRLESICRSRRRFQYWRKDKGQDYPDLLPGDIITNKTSDHSHSGIVGPNKQIIHLPGPCNWFYFNRSSDNDMERTMPIRLAQVGALGYDPAPAI